MLMSRTALLIALLLSFVLALVWAYTSSVRAPAPAGPGETTHVLAFDPSAITRIDLVDADSRLVIARDALLRWTVSRTAESPLDPPWPIEATALQAALAAVSSAPLSPTSSPLSGDRRAITLALHAKDARFDLTVHPPVGARAGVYADPPRRWFTAPADAFELFTPANTSALRTTAALPSASVNADELAIETPDGAPIVLVRLGSRWSLIEPVVSPADPDAVSRLLSALASLRFASLRPSPDPLPLTPALSISLTIHASDGETIDRFPVQERLVLADRPSGSRASTPTAAARYPGGPMYPLLPADLTVVPTNPEPLVHRFASPVSLHDVAAVTIDFIHPPLTRRLRRELDGWTQSDRLPDETQSRATQADDAHIDELLRFLLTTRATSLSLTHPDGHEQPLARIRIQDVADRTLDECALVRTPLSPDTPATRSGKVLRHYSTITPALLTP